MKEILSTILASNMILSTTGFVAPIPEIIEKSTIVYTQAQSSPESDFKIVEGIITGYSGAGGDVVIPSTIGGVEVKRILATAFENNTNLESIVMPSTLEHIDDSAFAGCTNLRSVELNEGLKYIGSKAFELTRSLSAIWFPSTVTEIGSYAFSNSGLTSLYVPENVESVGEYAFQECTRLTSAIFMANVTTIQRATFYNCLILEEVYLREGIDTIGRSAFNRCISLKEITLPSTTKTIGQSAFYGCSKIEKFDFTNTKLETVDFYAFQYCTSLTEAIFPYGFHTFATGENSTQIDRGQFIGCTSLVNVVLPSTVTECYFHFVVGNNNLVLAAINTVTGKWELLIHPFIDCDPSLVIHSYPNTKVSNMTSYTDKLTLATLSDEDKNPTITPTTPPVLPTKSDFEVVAPQVSAEYNAKASQESDFVIGAGGIITSYTGNGGNVVIPSTIDGKIVYGIGEEAFKNVSSIKSITMPSTLERIEGSAFYGCINLETVNLNKGLNYIGVSAFEGTTSLSSIWLPDSLLEIRSYAFKNTGLTSVYVPETVRIMGEYVFEECSKLSSVIFMPDIDIVPRATFSKCTALEDVYIREGVKTIGRSAFNACTSLKEITLPTTTKSINEYAFYGCSSLEKMDMTNTRLINVEFYAFQKCTSLTEVIFPYGFVSFGFDVNPAYTGREQFNGCASLEKVVLPSTIDSTTYYSYVSSVLYHPFENTNPALIVMGYPETCIDELANHSKTNFTFVALDIADENQNPTITPTTPPTLPTDPTIVETSEEITPTVTEETQTTPSVTEETQTAPLVIEETATVTEEAQSTPLVTEETQTIPQAAEQTPTETDTEENSSGIVSWFKSVFNSFTSLFGG